MSSTSPLAGWNLVSQVIAFGIIFLSILPYLLAPFLPERYKAKKVIELDCTVQKAFDTLVEDPRKCPMTGKQTVGLEASRKDADKQGRPLKWKEEIMKGRLSEIFAIEQTFDYKKGETARVVRTSKHERHNIESEWTYEIEPLDNGNKCRVTLEGYTDIKKDGSYLVPMYRFSMLMMTPQKGMKEHLIMLSDAAGAERTWIS